MPQHVTLYNQIGSCRKRSKSFVSGIAACWPDSTSYVSSSSIMAPFFAGNSCDPFTPEDMPCTLGNYVDFAINVSEPADISKGIAFASKRNIRLVVQNTGHELGLH